ncbi:acyltransferase [Comamonas sp. 17RB]|uniref:acyltransferase n=1 Tax=Comamonas sp. 17RB TaxID=3047025 RepID=UPI0024B7A17A|nr:acyltransferase [Comamonas sp. 17RB]MDI9855073.1 acyltransferase [Comamonas sp. 17RB]
MADNYILLHKEDHIEVHDYRKFKFPGLDLKIVGDFNTVKIKLPLKLDRCSLFIESSYSSFEIGSSERLISFGATIKNGNHQKVKIGEEFSCGHAILISQENYSKITIGNDCMFSADITMMVGDGHSIRKKDDELTIKNWGGEIFLGDHIWVGRSVKIAKGTHVRNNSIIAFGSVVSKKFDAENISIGGAPAKIISEDLSWDRLPQKIFHKEKIDAYGIQDFIGTEEELRALVKDNPDKVWVDFFIKNYALQNSSTREEIVCFEKKFDANNSDLGLLKYLVSLYLRFNDFYSIKLLFEKYAVSAKKIDYWGLITWSRALYNLGDIDASKNLALEAIGNADSDWLRHCAKVFLESNEEHVVVDVAKNIIGKNNEDYEFSLDFLINHNLSKKNFIEAKKYLDQILLINNGNYFYTLKIVNCCMILKDFERVIGECQKVILKNKKIMWSYWHLSIAYEKMGLFKNSLKIVEEASLLEKNNDRWDKRSLHLKSFL